MKIKEVLYKPIESFPPGQIFKGKYTPNSSKNPKKPNLKLTKKKKKRQTI
jgi:hypothetical protein